MRDQHVFLWQSLEILKVLNTLTLKQIFWKTHHFHTKRLCQKPTLRQIVWGVQNGPITKNWVLPVTILFFRKICFSFRTSHKELIWCTNPRKMTIFILWNALELHELWVCKFRSQNFVEASKPPFSDILKPYFNFTSNQNIKSVNSVNSELFHGIWNSRIRKPS